MKISIASIAASVALSTAFTCFVSPASAQESNTDNTEISDSLSEEALMERGNAFLEAGNFASARLVFQAAARRGNGRAAMLTGVTFDPRYRELTGASGPKPNAKLARQWYALAVEMGDDQAGRNDSDLVQWLEQHNIDPDQSVAAEEEIATPADSAAALSAEGVEAPPPEARSPEGTLEPESPTETAAAPAPAEAPEGMDKASQLLDTRPDPEAAEGSAEPQQTLEAAKPVVPQPAPGANSPTPSFDERVVRAQLTSAVNDREPVDRLPSSINVSGGKVDKITFFSEVRDLAGHGLSHRWEREGRTMADVPFSVRGNTWRMHSSKRITAAMTGTWRVVIVDKSGAELASVPFVLE